VSSKHKRCDNATLAKLWHYRLGHIFRGRIEWLIKDDILQPLYFLIQIIASIVLKESTLSKLRKVKPSKVRRF
jgi:hypothetical protein